MKTREHFENSGLTKVSLGEEKNKTYELENDDDGIKLRINGINSSDKRAIMDPEANDQVIDDLIAKNCINPASIKRKIKIDSLLKVI